MHDVLYKADNALADKFKKECVQHSKLRHPNIVQFLGVYTKSDSSLPILVMEYMPLSLSNCLEDYPEIPPLVKYHILLGVSVGLAYLQERGLVHRDLTANNILLTKDMIPKISDFGVSRLIAANKLTSTLTKIPGNFHYMPPEAFKEKPEYDKQLDIFSFGVLTIYVALQKFPIPSAVVGGTAVQNRTSLLSQMDSEKTLKSLATSCLNDVPSQRPQISEIIAKLEELVSSCKNELPDFLDAFRSLVQCRGEKQSLLSKAQSLQSQLTTVSNLLENTASMSEPEVVNVRKQIECALETANSVIGERISAGENYKSSFVVNYKHPSVSQQDCTLQLTLVPNSSTQPPPECSCSIVISPPVNLTFSGTYARTITSSLKKAWGVAACKNTDRVFVVDNNGFDSVIFFNADGSRSTLIESARYYQLYPQELSCWYPTSVAVMSENIIIVADSGNKRLIKLKVPEKSTDKATILAKTEKNVFSGSRAVESPVGIAVSNKGSVVACDRENHQLAILDSDLKLIKRFGSGGAGPYEFQHPWGVAFDSQSNLYVSDCSNSCIKVFNHDFKALRTISGPGNMHKNLRGPTGICIDANDFLYVADKNNSRVYVFDPAGDMKMYFGSYGSANGQFIKPLGVAVDKDGFIYVSDGERGRVQVFA